MVGEGSMVLLRALHLALLQGLLVPALAVADAGDPGPGVHFEETFATLNRTRWVPSAWKVRISRPMLILRTIKNPTASPSASPLPSGCASGPRPPPRPAHRRVPWNGIRQVATRTSSATVCTGHPTAARMHLLLFLGDQAHLATHYIHVQSSRDTRPMPPPC